MPGLGLDAVDRLLDPDPDPRLPARRAARRTDAGRRMSEHLPNPPEVVGIRNVLRARWRALPFWHRVAIVDRARAPGRDRALLRRPLARLRRRDRRGDLLAAPGAAAPVAARRARLGLISIFLFAGVPSLAAALAIAFALFWSPSATAAGRCPAVALLLAVLYPFYAAEDVHDPGVRRRGRTSRRASTCSCS